MWLSGGGVVGEQHQEHFSMSLPGVWQVKTVQNVAICAFQMDIFHATEVSH